MCTMKKVFSLIGELKAGEESARNAIDREYIEAGIEDRPIDWEYLDDQILDVLDLDEEYIMDHIRALEPTIVSINDSSAFF